MFSQNSYSSLRILVLKSVCLFLRAIVIKKYNAYTVKLQRKIWIAVTIGPGSQNYDGIHTFSVDNEDNINNKFFKVYFLMHTFLIWHRSLHISLIVVNKKLSCAFLSL
jgi:hypothetical protein